MAEEVVGTLLLELQAGLFGLQRGLKQGVQEANQAVQQVVQANNTGIQQIVQATNGMASQIEAMTKAMIARQTQGQRTASEQISAIVRKLQDDLGKATMDGVQYRIAAVKREAAETVRSILSIKASKEETERALVANAQATQAKLTAIQREEAEKRANIAKQEADKAAQAANQQAEKVKAAFGRVSIGSAALFAGSSLAIGGAVSQFAAFEATLNKVQAVSGATAEGMGRIKQAAIDLGIQTQFSTQQAAEGFFELSKAGLTVQEQLDAMPGVISLAAAAGIGLGEAAETAAGTVRGFGLAMKDTTKVADILAQAANQSAVDVSDLAMSFKYIAPVAAASNQSLQGMSAVLAVLGNNMIKGEQAGTSMRAALLKLQAPSHEASKALKTIGLHVADASGKMRPFTDIIRELSDKTAKFTQVSQAKIFENIFGLESVSAVSALVNAVRKSPEEFKRMEDAMRNADGAAKGMADTMNQGVAFSLVQLKSSSDVAAQSIGEVFAPAVKVAVDALTGMVNAFNQAGPIIKGFVAGALGLGALFGGVGLGAAAAAKAVSLYKDASLLVTATFPALAAGLSRVAALFATTIPTGIGFAIVAIGAAIVAWQQYRAAQAEEEAALANLDKAQDDHTAKLADLRRSQEGVVGQTKFLAVELETLAGKNNRTAAETQRLHEISDQLKKLNPGLRSTIDAVASGHAGATSIINAKVAAYDRLTAAALRAAQAEAGRKRMEAVNATQAYYEAKGTAETAILPANADAARAQLPELAARLNAARNARTDAEKLVRELRDAAKGTDIKPTPTGTATLGGGLDYNAPGRHGKGGGSSGKTEAQKEHENELEQAIKAIEKAGAREAQLAEDNQKAVVAAFEKQILALKQTGAAYATTADERRKISDAIRKTEEGLSDYLADQEVKRSKEHKKALVELADEEAALDQSRHAAEKRRITKHFAEIIKKLGTDTEAIKRAKKAMSEALAAVDTGDIKATSQARIQSQMEAAERSTNAQTEALKKAYEAGHMQADEYYGEVQRLDDELTARKLANLDMQLSDEHATAAEKVAIQGQIDATLDESAQRAIQRQDELSKAQKASAINVLQGVASMAQGLASVFEKHGNSAGAKLAQGLGDGLQAVVGLMTTGPLALIPLIIKGVTDVADKLMDRTVSWQHKVADLGTTILGALPGIGMFISLGKMFMDTFFPDQEKKLFGADDTKAQMDAIADDLGKGLEKLRDLPADMLGPEAQKLYQKAADDLTKTLKDGFVPPEMVQEVTNRIRAYENAAKSFKLDEAATDAQEELDKLNQQLTSGLLTPEEFNDKAEPLLRTVREFWQHVWETDPERIGEAEANLARIDGMLATADSKLRKANEDLKGLVKERNATQKEWESEGFTNEQGERVGREAKYLDDRRMAERDHAEQMAQFQKQRQEEETQWLKGYLDDYGRSISRLEKLQLDKQKELVDYQKRLDQLAKDRLETEKAIAKSFQDEKDEVNGILQEGLASREITVTQDKLNRIDKVREKFATERKGYQDKLAQLKDEQDQEQENHKKRMSAMDAEYTRDQEAHQKKLTDIAEQEEKQRVAYTLQMTRLQNEWDWDRKAHQKWMDEQNEKIQKASELANRLASAYVPSGSGGSSGGSTGGLSFGSSGSINGTYVNSAGQTNTVTTSGGLILVNGRVPGQMNGGKVPGYATGGPVMAVPGPPGNSTDRVLAWLTPGEPVVSLRQASVIDRLIPLLQSLANASMPSLAAAGGGGVNVTLEVNVTGNTFPAGSKPADLVNLVNQGVTRALRSMSGISILGTR